MPRGAKLRPMERKVELLKMKWKQKFSFLRFPDIFRINNGSKRNEHDTKPKPVDGWLDGWFLPYLFSSAIHWNRNISRIFFCPFPIIFTMDIWVDTYTHANTLHLVYPQLGLDSPEPLNGPKSSTIDICWKYFIFLCAVCIHLKHRYVSYVNNW